MADRTSVDMFTLALDSIFARIVALRAFVGETREVEHAFEALHEAWQASKPLVEAVEADLRRGGTPSYEAEDVEEALLDAFGAWEAFVVELATAEELVGSIGKRYAALVSAAAPSSTTPVPLEQVVIPFPEGGRS